MISGAAGAIATAPTAPAWISAFHWNALPVDLQQAAGSWHSRLPSVPAWLTPKYSSTCQMCDLVPMRLSEAVGGQRAPPSPDAPDVSVVMHLTGPDATVAASLRALIGCANELPSAEYLLIDDRPPAASSPGGLRSALPLSELDAPLVCTCC